MFNWLHTVLDWLRRVVTEPRNELNHWQRAARFAYDLVRHGARQLRRDRAPQMAAALSFRTLFGLLPVLVVGTILIRAIGGSDQFTARLAEFFSALSLDQYEIGTSGAGEAVASQSLSSWLLGLVAGAGSINLAAITWVGVFVLIYSAISLMVTIEGSFNVIFRAPEGRAWHRRLPMYWTLLTLWPAAIAGTVVFNNWIDAQLLGASGWWSILQVAVAFWTFIVTWLVMFTLYKWVPNTTVNYRPALIGAFVTALLLELGKGSLDAYLGGAISIRQLYGSLGLIPLFMFWVYLMWLVVLFGLEVAATLQFLRGRRLDELKERAPTTGLVDPASIVTVMQVIADRFADGTSTGATVISERCGIAEATVVRMVDGLVNAGLLHRVSEADGSVTLARPPAQITADQLIHVGYELTDDVVEPRLASMLRRLREPQTRLASQLTLAGIGEGLPAQDPPSP